MNAATSPTPARGSVQTIHLNMPLVLSVQSSCDPNYGGLNATRAACFIPKWIG